MRGPQNPAGFEVEAFHPTVDTKLTARGADDHAVLHHEGRHRCGFAFSDVGDRRIPYFAPCARIDCDGVAIEQVVDDLAVGVEGAAVDDIATRDADRIRADGRPVLPFQRIAFLLQIERVQHIRIRRDDIHRVVHDQRLTFMSAKDAGGERPDGVQPRGVLRIDECQTAVTRGGVVLRGHRPLAVFVQRGRGVGAAANANREMAAVMNDSARASRCELPCTCSSLAT